MRSRFVTTPWIVALVLLLAALAGCQEAADEGAERSETAAAQSESRPADSNAPSSTSQPAAAEPEPACETCGTVSAIDKIKTEGEASGAGAATGALVGVVIGNQIGSGSGKDIAKVVGGVGGAIAGHQAEKKIRAKTFYQVSVSMETGGTRVVEVASAEGIDVGTKVHVKNGSLFLRGN